MSGEKLRVAKIAVEEAIARLQPDDRFSVVVYDDVVDVVIESTTASAEARRGAIERLRTIEARGSTNLGEGWLRGCEQVAGPPRRPRRQPLPAADRRPRQRRHHRSGPAGDPRCRAARPRGLDLDVRGRQRLRRAAPPGPRRRRRRPLLLHRGRAADPRRDHVRGRARRSRSWPATSTSRSPPATTSGSSRSARTAASTRGNRTRRLARRPRLGAGRRGRPAPVVPVRRPRPGDRGHRGPDRSRRRLRTGRGRRSRARAADLELRRRSRQRRPAARPRRRSGGRPPVRGAGATGGGAAQPRRRLRRAPGASWRRPRDGSAAMPGTIAELREPDRRARGRAGRSSPRRWPNTAASRRISRAPTLLRSRDASGRSVQARPEGGAHRHRRDRQGAPRRSRGDYPADHTVAPRRTVDRRRDHLHASFTTAGRARDPRSPGPAAARRRAGRGARQRPSRARPDRRPLDEGPDRERRCRATSSRSAARSRPAKRQAASRRPRGGGGSVVGASWNAGGPILAQVRRGSCSRWTAATGSARGASVDDGGRAGYSLVLTAGHCAIDETNGRFATNWMFIPAFDTAPTYTCSRVGLRLLDGGRAGRPQPVRDGRLVQRPGGHERLGARDRRPGRQVRLGAARRHGRGPIRSRSPGVRDREQAVRLRLPGRRQVPRQGPRLLRRATSARTRHRRTRPGGWPAT